MSSNSVPAQRTLRLVTLITFPPAFIMLLIHGILGGGAFPAVALIPLAISALLALYLLNPNAVTAGGSAITLADGHVVAIDLSLAIWLFVMCICSWINVPRWRHDRGLVMLGTYGSVWVMVNWCVCPPHCMSFSTVLNLLTTLQRYPCVRRRPEASGPDRIVCASVC